LNTNTSPYRCGGGEKKKRGGKKTPLGDQQGEEGAAHNGQKGKEKKVVFRGEDSRNARIEPEPEKKKGMFGPLPSAARKGGKKP